MTPKEKAEELVEKFTDIENKYNEYSDFKQAKQCALIAVDEIINTLDSERIKYSSDYCFEENKYWTEVKQEIEKL